MKISANKFVSVEYELSVDGEKGGLELMEKATAMRPMNFIYGIGLMLPKFEEHLLGLGADDKFEFTIANDDAYGPYDDDDVVEFERKVFETHGKFDEDVIFIGNTVPLMDDEGNRFQAQVVKITDKHVTVDFNHPLAGETLHFKGSILDVHEATNEELAALIGTCSGGCDCDCDFNDCRIGGCDHHPDSTDIDYNLDDDEDDI